MLIILFTILQIDNRRYFKLRVPTHSEVYPKQIAKEVLKRKGKNDRWIYEDIEKADSKIVENYKIIKNEHNKDVIFDSVNNKILTVDEILKLLSPTENHKETNINEEKLVPGYNASDFAIELSELTRKLTAARKNHRETEFYFELVPELSDFKKFLKNLNKEIKDNERAFEPELESRLKEKIIEMLNENNIDISIDKEKSLDSILKVINKKSSHFIAGFIYSFRNSDDFIDDQCTFAFYLVAEFEKDEEIECLSFFMAPNGNSKYDGEFYITEDQALENYLMGK